MEDASVPTLNCASAIHGGPSDNTSHNHSQFGGEHTETVRCSPDLLCASISESNPSLNSFDRANAAPSRQKGGNVSLALVRTFDLSRTFLGLPHNSIAAVLESRHAIEEQVPFFQKTSASKDSLLSSVGQHMNDEAQLILCEYTELLNKCQCLYEKWSAKPSWKQFRDAKRYDHKFEALRSKLDEKKTALLVAASVQRALSSLEEDRKSFLQQIAAVVTPTEPDGRDERAELNSEFLPQVLLQTETLDDEGTISGMSLDESLMEQNVAVPQELASLQTTLGGQDLCLIREGVEQTEADNVPAQKTIEGDDSTATSLDFRFDDIDDKRMVPLSDALSNNHTVKELRLDRNQIGDEGVASLASALRSNQTLIKLNLDGNNFGDRGAVQLAGALEHNRSITYLALERNKIASRGASAIAKSLSVNCTLERLDLSGNAIGTEGVAEIALSLQSNSSLTTLKLDDNRLGDDGARTVAEALRYNQTLTKLNVRNNHITDSGASTFEEVLMCNQTLTRLNLKGNEQISGELISKIQRSLQRNEASLVSGTTPWTSEERNRVVVLFSNPLVWRDEEGYIYPITATLNFKLEKETLQSCIRDSQKDINILFDVATDSRFQELVSGRCGCLHFSGHGMPAGDGHDSRIIFEDRMGGAHFLSPSDLSELLPSCREPFLVVFVAACHSQAIGQAFIASGARHVICCEHESELDDAAASEFTRAFYGSLVKGFTVKSSFSSGKGAVSVRFCAEESNKFMLLPKDEDHDVTVFAAKQLVQCNDRPVVQSHIPPPPYFLGRERVMHEVVSSILLGQRLVTVVGEQGIGMSSLACSVALYIEERLSSTLDINDVLYVERSTEHDDINGAFLVQLHEELFGTGMTIGSQERELTERICDVLNGSKVLIILDSVNELGDKICSFLHELFQKSGTVKVLITSVEPIGFSSFGVDEKCIDLSPLDTVSASQLFRKTCPHTDMLADRYDLVNILMALATSPISGRKKDSISTIIQAVKKGVPSQIVKAAQNVSKHDYNRLFSDPMDLVSAATLLGRTCPHANCYVGVDLDVRDILLCEIESDLGRMSSCVIRRTVRKGNPKRIVQTAQSMTQEQFHDLFYDSLDSESAAKLFGMVCPHFDPKNEDSIDSLSIFHSDHDCVPARVIKIATSLSKEEYEARLFDACCVGGVD